MKATIKIVAFLYIIIGQVIDIHSILTKEEI